MAPALRRRVVERILARFAPDGETRREALRDVLMLGIPNLNEESAAEMARFVPELPAELYEKWAGLFADRLLETADERTIGDLCAGDADNEAALALVFAMFMESERMEKIVAEDLKNLPGAAPGGEDKAALLGLWLRGRSTGSTQ